MKKEEKSELKTLGNLTPAAGSNRRKKRLGRGIGSGLGKTAGKGHKGQLARKGGKVAPGFEGGQMPIYRRLPKRGFKNHFTNRFVAVNLDMLNRFEAGLEVTPAVLKKAGLIKSKNDKVKILGRGKLEKKLVLKVHKVSTSAQKALDTAGAKVEIISVAPSVKKDKRQ